MRIGLTVRGISGRLQEAPFSRYNLAMAANIPINELGEHIGETVTVAGWLYNARAGGKILFLIVRDGTGHVQCILEKADAAASLFDDAKHLPQESAVRVTARSGGRAIRRRRGTAGQRSGDHSPGRRISDHAEAHGIDFLFKHRHLWLRSKRQHTILSIRSTLIDAIRRFFTTTVLC